MSSFVTNQHGVNEPNQLQSLKSKLDFHDKAKTNINELQFLKSKLDFHDKAKTNINELQLLLTKYKGDMTNYSDLVLAELKSSQPTINKIIKDLNPEDKQLVDDFMVMVQRIKSNNIKDDEVKTLLQNNGLVESPNVPLLIKRGGVQMDDVDNAVKLLQNIVTDFTTNTSNKKYYNIVKLNNNNNNFDRLIQYAFIYYDYSNNQDAIKDYCEDITEHADDITKTLNKIIADIFTKIKKTDVRHGDVNKTVSEWLLEEILKSNHTLKEKQRTFLKHMENKETVLNAKIYFFNDTLETIVQNRQETDVLKQETDVLKQVIGPYKCSVYNNFFRNEINDIVLEYDVDKVVTENKKHKESAARQNSHRIERLEKNIEADKQTINKYESEIKGLENEIVNYRVMLDDLTKKNGNITLQDLLKELYDKIIGSPLPNNKYKRVKRVEIINYILTKTYPNGNIHEIIFNNQDYMNIIEKAKVLDEIIMLEDDINAKQTKIDKITKDLSFALNRIRDTEKKKNQLEKSPQQNNENENDKKMTSLKKVEKEGGVSIQKLLSNFSISPQNENENLNTYTFPYDWFNKPFDDHSETIKNNQKINIVNDAMVINNQNNIENLFTYGTKQGNPNRRQIASQRIDILSRKSDQIDNNQWILDTAFHENSQTTAINISLSIIAENFSTIIKEHFNIIDTLFSNQVNRSIVFKKMNEVLKEETKTIVQEKKNVTKQLKDVMDEIENEIQKEKAEIEKNTTTRGLLGAICFIFFGGILLYIVDFIFMHGALTGLIAKLISVIFSTLLAPFYAILNFISSAKGAQTVYNSTTTKFGNGAIWLGNKFASVFKQKGWNYIPDNTMKDTVEAIVSELSFLHIILLVIYGIFALLLYVNGPAVKKTIGDFVFKWLAKILDFMCKIPGVNRFLCGELSNQREKYLKIINDKLQEITNKQNTEEMLDKLRILSKNSITALQNEELSDLIDKLKKSEGFEILTTQMQNVNATVNATVNANNKKNQGGSKISRKNKYKRHYIASKRRHANIKKIRITKKMRGGNNPEFDILLRTIMAFINNIIELVLYGKTATIDANNNMVERILDDENIFNSFFNIVYECFTNIRIPVPKKNTDYTSQYNSSNKNKTQKVD